MLYVVIAVLIVGALVSLYRLRRGGPGPAVNGVPRRMRSGLNENFEKAGWQKPYQEDGERNPDRSQL